MRRPWPGISRSRQRRARAASVTAERVLKRGNIGTAFAGPGRAPARSKSPTIIRGQTFMTPVDPIHPGEHLAEILDELGISPYRLARTIGVPPRRISDIRSRAPLRDGGYRAPHRTGPPHDAGVLAEPPANVRSRSRPRSRRHRRDKTACRGRLNVSLPNAPADAVAPGTSPGCPASPCLPRCARRRWCRSRPIPRVPSSRRPGRRCARPGRASRTRAGRGRA